MITEAKFKELLERSETDTIDYKRTMYDFDNDTENKKLAAYLKDIISFSNTIRNESSFIIIGVHKNPDNSFELYGIDKHIDESILQAKVTNKIFPVPKFKYYTFNYNNMKFGIFEFPIQKYQVPLSPTSSMKGLVVNQPYYRKGSMNTEAIGTTLIEIHEWFKSLPDYEEENIIDLGISQLLIKATDINSKLSILFAEALTFSERHKLQSLKQFCLKQLVGPQNDEAPNHKYRIIDTFFMSGTINDTITIVDKSYITSFLKSQKNYFPYKYFLNFTITDIESKIKLTDESKGFNVIRTTTKAITEDVQPPIDITLFIFGSDYHILYNNIRQAFITTLINTKEHY